MKRIIVPIALFLLIVTYASSVLALDAPAITAAAKGPNQINLTWSAVPDPGYGYKIEIQSAADSRYSSWTEIATAPYWVTESHYKDPQDNTASQYPVFSLRNNTSYSFRVRTYKGDASPVYSTYSNTASVTTRNYVAYYVNITSGADNTACGALASPCRTISYAINTRDLAAGGRVIIISAGNYANDYIRPVRSGSAGVDNKIVIMAEPGSTVNITSSNTNPISVSYNYVVIDGITVTSDYNDNMVAISGSYNALANCEFDGSGNVSWGPLIAGSYNLVHGVYSHDFGSADVDAGSAMQTVGSTIPANYNIIQYSLLRRGSHDTALTKNNANYNQWMNNVMDGGWGIGWAVVSDSYAVSANNLFEGNIVRDTAKNKTITNYKPGIQISGDYNTIRRNVIYDGNRTGTNSNPSPGIEISRLTGYGAHHNLIYNNAIYHNGGRAIVFMDGASENDNIIANNIMYYNYGDTAYCPNSLNVHIRGVTTNTVVHHNQILYKDWTTGIENPNQGNMVLYSNNCMSLSTAESNYGVMFYNNVTYTPNFVSESSDFHLNSNSQLIDAGQVVTDATWGTLSYRGTAPDIGAYEGDGGPPVPVLQFSAATYSVSEAGPTATITATRTGSAAGAVSVSYATSNGTATAGSDYTAVSGTLNWASGDTAAKTFTVAIIDDAVVESNETVNITLSNPTNGAVIGSPSAVALTITDNDSAGGGGGGNTPPPSSGGGGSGSGGDSGSGGGGCGYIKDINGKGPRAKGEGLALMIMLIIVLAGIALARKAMYFKSILFFIFFIFFLLLHFSIANAADYYVATNGSDANTGTLAQPWKTVQKAANTLVAGDTAYIRSGTYLENNILFTNSGTATQPITIKNYTGETPVIDGGFSNNLVGQSAIGVFESEGKNYITFDGLEIMRGWRANIYLGRNVTTSNIIIQNCNLHDLNAYDNSGHIFFGNYISNITVRNNKMHHVILAPTSSGTSGEGVWIGMGSGSYVIENNEMYDLIQGIWAKYKQNDNAVPIMRNNLIHGIVVAGIQITANNVNVTNNIIYNSGGIGIKVYDEATSCSGVGGVGTIITHNTIVDTLKGIVLYGPSACTGALNTIIKDNLIYNFTNSEHRGLSVWPYKTVDTSNTTFDHNLIYSSSFSSPIRVLGNYYTTATAPLTGTSNIQQAPIFKDYANKDFTLLSNSPGYKAASDGYDMGADTSLPPTPTTGGGGSGGGNTPPPSSGSGSGGSSDSGGGSGGGCGYIKDDNGKGQGAKGEGLSIAILLLLLIHLKLRKNFFYKTSLDTNSTFGGKKMCYKLKLISIMFLLLFVVYAPAHATVYFYYDAENGTVGNGVPREPNGVDICTQGCTSTGSDATVQSAGGAGQGSQYFQWVTTDNQPSAYTEIVNHNTFPMPVSLGTTYYLAFFFNFTRINGLDIWHETGGSGDKGVEIYGASGIRWSISFGHWGPIADNQDHRYTLWLSNARDQLNPEQQTGEIFVLNQNGYSAANPLQLQYERWYSAVMAIRIASDKTGYAAVWIDGLKIAEYNNVRTVVDSSAIIGFIAMNGTIAQPAYDAPAHIRKFDALMLTDNWQDIINGGYLNGGGGSGGGNTPPPSSGGDTTSSGGGGGCGFVKDDNGKGQKAKGEGLILMIMLIITLSFFVLAERYKHVLSFVEKCNHWREYGKNTDSDERRADKEIKKNSF